ncbi:hypothetical protein GLYMA_09G240051v4 [Glycine max]|nr:hypothetical protein GLYMA_09G240051v4 [Glycine max]KAH1044531.1 hypothetical protein GYH30_026013 [Glycine max]
MTNFLHPILLILVDTLNGHPVSIFNSFRSICFFCFINYFIKQVVSFSSSFIFFHTNFCIFLCRLLMK